jgi:hypothetical protein
MASVGGVGGQEEVVDGVLELSVIAEDEIETLVRRIVKHPDTDFYTDDTRVRFLDGELSLFFDGRTIVLNEPCTLDRYDIVPWRKIYKDPMDTSSAADDDSRARQRATLEIRPWNWNLRPEWSDNDDDDDEGSDEDYGGTDGENGMNQEDACDDVLTGDAAVGAFFPEVQQQQQQELQQQQQTRSAVDPTVLSSMLNSYRKETTRDSWDTTANVRLPPLPSGAPPRELQDAIAAAQAEQCWDTKTRKSSSSSPEATPQPSSRKKRAHKPRDPQEREKTSLMLLQQFKREYKAAKREAEGEPDNRELKNQYRRAKRRYKEAMADRQGQVVSLVSPVGSPRASGDASSFSSTNLPMASLQASPVTSPRSSAMMATSDAAMEPWQQVGGVSKITACVGGGVVVEEEEEEENVEMGGKEEEEEEKEEGEVALGGVGGDTLQRLTGYDGFQQNVVSAGQEERVVVAKNDDEFDDASGEEKYDSLMET